MTNDLASGADTVFAVATSSAFQRDGVCFAARRSGLVRSEDRGASWHPAIPNESRSLIATAVRVHPDPAAGPLVVAGVAGGVVVSRNGGESWQSVTLSVPAPIVSVILLATDGVALAGTFEDGMYRSDDGGVTWSPANAGLLDHCVLALAISPAFERDQTVFAGTASGLATSHNAGRSWTDTELPDHLAPVMHVAVASGAGGHHRIVVAAESSGLWRSEDSGATWQAIELPEASGDVAALDWTAAGLLMVGERAAFITGDPGHGWKRLWDLDAGEATIATASPTADLNVGVIVGLNDGSIRRLG